jgi:CheY-like chemotaxis protein
MSSESICGKTCTYPLDGQKLLVVDDVLSITMLLCRQLERRGALRCMRASDGREAVMTVYELSDTPAAEIERLVALSAHDFAELSNHQRLSPAQLSRLREGLHAVLLDGSMPVLSGYQAARILRHIGVTLPIIGVSANALAEDRRAFIAAGADAFVSKPVDMQALTELLWDVQTHPAADIAPAVRLAVHMSTSGR